MEITEGAVLETLPGIVLATGESALYQTGDKVRVLTRKPIGHYRVPIYLRGKSGVVQSVIKPALDNEAEGFGRNAGRERHYYRITVSMAALWVGYAGAPGDALLIEVFETWLERI
jgi:nitrile hydratase